ncbi:MAG TPA: hypothetical protein VF614_08705 [Chthoniobacteraceae bacterium]
MTTQRPAGLCGSGYTWKHTISTDGEDSTAGVLLLAAKELVRLVLELRKVWRWRVKKAAFAFLATVRELHQKTRLVRVHHEHAAFIFAVALCAEEEFRKGVPVHSSGNTWLREEGLVHVEAITGRSQ